MRRLRRFSVLLLSSLAVTGCHHRRKPVFPPHQAEAPIIAELPPMPPLAFPNVHLPRPKPVPPLPEPAAPALPPVTVQPVHGRHSKRRREPAESKSSNDRKKVSGAAVLGELSADDAATTPHQDKSTERLIQSTESRLKQFSSTDRSRHKEALAHIRSFLAQARQAWSMNDMVGAQTLANKAKIMLDELLK